MNWTKFIFAFVVAFIFVFFFGFLWHGILMKPAYMEIASHYRPHDDMQWGPMLIGHALMSFYLTWIVVRYGRGGLREGMKLGVLISFMFIGLHFIRFAVEPLTMKILWMGAVADVLELGIAGAIVGAIYKPKQIGVG